MSGSERLTLTVTETAQTLNVSRPTVYRLIERTDFPALRIGKRVLISRAGLREWIAQQAGKEAGDDD